jgi:hypothetical protein
VIRDVVEFLSTVIHRRESEWIRDHFNFEEEDDYEPT